MSTGKKAAPAPGNVYVNLDSVLPSLLNLRVGQNLIFVRAFSSAGGPFLRSLKMPVPYFVTADDLGYGTQIPGQAKGTYIAALALVHCEGAGEIVIRFAAHSPDTVSRPAVRLKFVVTG